MGYSTGSCAIAQGVLIIQEAGLCQSNNTRVGTGVCVCLACVWREVGGRGVGKCVRKGLI